MDAVHALEPAITLLVFGILAVLLTRPVRLSPIVGYLIAGWLIGPHGLAAVAQGSTTHLLAELGVVFLLFDIGLHFSLAHLWEARRDILGFGPLQVVLCALPFAVAMLAQGFSTATALLVGTTLALSSTAVAVQTLVEHEQQSCPIGISATSVLILQDICAIFLLIMADSLEPGGGAPLAAVALALVKSAGAFAAAIALGRLLIEPLFRLLARTRNEEVFTAIALLIVLLAAFASGTAGLSLTLGAFLAGMTISETPFRHVIRTEVKPFRGLLLGFFFITVGMALDTDILVRDWAHIVLLLVLLVVSKTALIFVIARLLGKPLRIAIQLAFLLSQGSELAFVLFSMPAISQILGADHSATAMIAVAASLALTPTLAGLGNRIARALAERDRATGSSLTSAEVPGVPIVVFGMGEVGRRVADALTAHGIAYTAIEMDHDRFVRADADGYPVAFGDAADLRLMETMDIARRPAVVVTIPRYEISRELTPVLRQRYPNLVRYIAVDSEADRERFAALGMRAVTNRSTPRGLDLASAVLRDQGVSERKIEAWMHTQQEQALGSPAETLPARAA